MTEGWFLRAVKDGAVGFLNGVGKGVDTHAAKVEEAVGGDLPPKKADAPWKNVPRRRPKRSFVSSLD
jgi:hypothetical protein